MATTHPVAATNLLSVEEYLNTTYRPDVDYVDGQIEERNVGEFDHADLQTQIGTMLRNRQREWGVRVVGEARVRVSPTRIRIPDICVLDATLERERIITHPPLLWIEVLSPRDSLKSMRARAQDFFAMGTLHLWIFDPETRTAHVCTPTTIAAHLRHPPRPQHPHRPLPRKRFCYLRRLGDGAPPGWLSQMPTLSRTDQKKPYWERGNGLDLEEQPINI